MSVTAGVSDTVIAVRDKLRGRIGQTKVKRYWPGKAPEWADDNEEEGDIRMSRVSAAFPAQEASVYDPAVKDDPRLRRLAESRINRDEVRADLRRIRQAEIVSATEEEESRGGDMNEVDEDDEDAVEAQRRRIKEKARLREQAELPLEEEEEEEEKEEEEEESEYETESDEEEGGIVMSKPVFVHKQERETIAERERVEAEERALLEMVKRKMEERKVESKQLVVDIIRDDTEIIKSHMESEADVADVDTDDDINEAEEYETWKSREIARIKREREDRETVLKEKEEIEKVRNMTEEERREWERKNPKPAQSSKRKWSFMQKYYHKGAFFQDDPDDPIGTAHSDNIYHRDFSAPTGEDKMDKTILPKVMQVKHFGRSGRTKWTHLVNEDTTDWNAPWTYSDTLRTKYDSKMAGMKPIEKPKGSKKLKLEDWEKR